jgi:hypothetical protein
MDHMNAKKDNMWESYTSYTTWLVIVEFEKINE